VTAPKGPAGVEECEDNACAGCAWCDGVEAASSNRVICSDCNEASEVNLLAEHIEGLRMSCSHCGGVGTVVVHENDDGLAMLELVIPD
jgi:DnaJ-class molecular chaperone